MIYIKDKIINEELSLIRKYTSKVNSYVDGVSLAIGEPSVDVNKNIINKTKEALDNKKYKYTNAQGEEELLKEISIKEKVDISNILVTNGASEGIFITLLSILDVDDEVIIITPCYPQYAPVVKFCNAKVVYLDTSTTNFLPSYANLLNAVSTKTKAIIINTPSNPTGIIYDSATLKMINDFASKYNLYILCDDVYESLCYVDKKPYPFSLKNTIYFKSFSKSYAMTGYRLGYVVASDFVIKNLLKVHSFLTISVSPFIQKAGVEALRSSPVKKEEIYKNLKIVYEFLDDENIEYIEVDGGIFLFMNIEQFEISSITFCDELLQRYHVACVPGICFENDNFIRINFAVKREVLYKALERLKFYFADLRKEKMDFS